MILLLLNNKTALLIEYFLIIKSEIVYELPSIVPNRNNPSSSSVWP